MLLAQAGARTNYIVKRAQRDSSTSDEVYYKGVTAPKVGSREQRSASLQLVFLSPATGNGQQHQNRPARWIAQRPKPQA